MSQPSFVVLVLSSLLFLPTTSVQAKRFAHKRMAEATRSTTGETKRQSIRRARRSKAPATRGSWKRQRADLARKKGSPWLGRLNRGLRSARAEDPAAKIRVLRVGKGLAVTVYTKKLVKGEHKYEVQRLYGVDDNAVRAGEGVTSQTATGATFREAMSVLDATYLDGIDLSGLGQAALDGIAAGGMADNPELVRRSLRGATDQLDPYTRFIDPQQRQNEDRSFSGVTGVGVMFTPSAEGLRVVKVSRKSPASRAGLRKGDRIVAVDGKALVRRGNVSEKVVRSIGGDEGTDVKLTIQRQGKKITKTVTRAKLDPNGIYGQRAGDRGVAVIRLERFAEGAAEGIFDEVVRLQPSSLVLDLRGNPGGSLDEAMNILAMFGTSDMPLAKLKYKTEETEVARVPEGGGPFQDLPLVVLIDENSASASELVSGSLQENRRALIGGRKSYGKGIGQGLFNLADGSRVLVTTFRYYTPDRTPDKVGVKPDLSAKQLMKLARAENPRVVDPVLRGAVRHLEQQLEQRANASE